MIEISMKITVSDLWGCWKRFLPGKRRTPELELFAYLLEKNLFALERDLINGTYRHGNYRRFTVFENKRREIVVASIRDRIVHRLMYEYLVAIFDTTFIYDIWSCRRGKGLVGAIARAQSFMRQNRTGYVWRADIQKFFDHVDHSILLQHIERRVRGTRTRAILREIIGSYQISGVCERGDAPRKIGIPIGNLTSQIFANIYLNEFDRFVVHILKPRSYLRYGDDFVLFTSSKVEAISMREAASQFLKEQLHLSLHSKNDIIVKTRHGIHFLGVEIFPFGRKLKERMWRKIRSNFSNTNVSSYAELVRLHGDSKKLREINWRSIFILREWYY